MNKTIWAYVAIIVAMVIWSTAGIATKVALQAFLPLSLVTMRFTLAVVMMLIVGLASHRLQPLDKKDLPMFVLAGFVQPFIYYVCETYGMRLMNSPTVAEVFLCTSPLLAPIFAFLLIRERATWQNILGIIISTAGVIMMLMIGNDNFSIGSPWGVVLCFAAVVAAVLYTIILRRFPEHYNDLSIVFYVQLFGLLFFYPMWGILDLPDMIAAHSLNPAAAETINTHLPEAVSAIIYLAAFSSVLAFVLFSYTIRKIGVTRANAFNNIRPVFTALIMMLVFGEHLPLGKWMAMLLVIIGLFICHSGRVKTRD